MESLATRLRSFPLAVGLKVPLFFRNEFSRSHETTYCRAEIKLTGLHAWMRDSGVCQDNHAGLDEAIYGKRRVTFH